MEALLIKLGSREPAVVCAGGITFAELFQRAGSQVEALEVDVHLSRPPECVLAFGALRMPVDDLAVRHQRGRNQSAEREIDLLQPAPLLEVGAPHQGPSGPWRLWIAVGDIRVRT